MIRTDLAIEALDAARARGDMPGIEREESNICGVTVSRVKILDERGEKAVKKPCGTYVTVSCENFARTSTDNLEQIKRCVAKELSDFVKGKTQNGVLVVGLGNVLCTPDALGPKTAEKILVTRHMKRELSKMLDIDDLTAVGCLAPGVLGQTGIETGEIVRGVVERTKPSLVIAVDALAARSTGRLGSTVQLASAGISPGSGVGNKRAELSQSTLGLPVISIGVPLVVDAATLVHDLSGNEPDDREGRDMIVTPRDIDLLVEHSAALVADSVNRALHPSLDPEDIAALSG